MSWFQKAQSHFSAKLKIPAEIGNVLLYTRLLQNLSPTMGNKKPTDEGIKDAIKK